MLGVAGPKTAGFQEVSGYPEVTIPNSWILR